MRNSGTCTWTSAYYLAYAHGNTPQSQMGGQPTYIKGSVPPGGTYDISVNMVAPQQPGVYQGFWQMVNAKGTAFGTTVYVGIQVRGPHRRAGADANPVAERSASPSTRPTSPPASASPSTGTSRTSRRSTSTRKGRT